MSVKAFVKQVNVNGRYVHIRNRITKMPVFADFIPINSEWRKYHTYAYLMSVCERLQES